MLPYQPETYQYYFERYLRNKLSTDEKADFEQRLTSDNELKQLLENYKLNRKQFLRDLLKENNGKKTRGRIAPFIYLTITMAGIILATNFYYENLLLKEERQRDKNLITRLIEYIPFIGSKQTIDTISKTTPHKPHATNNKPISNTKHVDSLATEQAEPLFIFDTVIVPISRTFFDEKLHYYRSTIDSTLAFDDIKKLIINTFNKIDIKHKSKPIKIEFWQTLNTANKYSYDGLTLVLHAPLPPDDLFFVTDESELVWLNNNNELILITDNQLHQY